MSEIYPTSFIPFPQGKDHIPFLNMAHDNNFYIIYPLFSDWNAFQTYSESDFKRLLRAQIDEVGNHVSIIMWQFGNEMNWHGNTNELGFYPYPALMAKYNNYAQYIRQYTLARWGRKIPITHAVIDFPSTFDWLMERFDVDIFSLNTFRGTSTTTMFPGDGSSTKGFAYGTCAWNKPLLITEFGWNSYTSGWANQLMSDFVSRIDQGLIGIVLFEHNDEPHKPAGQKTFGAVSVTVTTDGDQTSLQPNVFLADTVAIKPIYNDVASGKFNGINYNYHSDFYTLTGRSAKNSNSIDDCPKYGTFLNCPGGYPACSGHGICSRITGVCSCAAGWTGVDCATPVCFCSERGNCSILTSPPQCVCLNGFYGPQCEKEIQDIDTKCPNDCTDSKNGVCDSTTNTCHCVSGWTGPDCSVISITAPFPELGVTRIIYPSSPRPSSSSVCVTVAEDETLSLSCPDSHLITSIQFASYGTPSGLCGSFARSSCDASSSLSVFSAQCLGKKSCSFIVGNNVFGDPCRSIKKNFYGQVTCSPAVSLCSGPIGEQGTLSLACPQSNQVISSVQFASYGNPTGTCGSFAKGSCDAPSSLSVFNTNCLHKNSCSFTVGNNAFTDPCRNTVKHFSSQVTCSTNVSVCAGPIAEGAALSLSCPPTHRINSVEFVSYGTPTGSCGSFSKGSCHASSSLNVFNNNCKNKNSCSFIVGNAAFTDPCGGIVKNLKVQATCSPA